MSRTSSTRNITSVAPTFIPHRRVSSCPNLPILGLDPRLHFNSVQTPPLFVLTAFGNMNSLNNYRSSPPSSSTATNSNDSTNMRLDTTTAITTTANPLQTIREQMMRQEHKYSHSYAKQEPLLPTPPPLLGDDTPRANDAETSTSDSNPHMRQPQDTLRSLLFASAASRADPYALSPRTPPMRAEKDHSNAPSRPGGQRQQLPPTPRTPGRRHAALAADAGWDRAPPVFFPRTLLPLEEASQEVTKRLRTESGPIPVASTSSESSSSSSSSSRGRMRPQFQSSRVLQTLASALSVPFPTNPTSTASNEVQPPGPPPLHVAQASIPDPSEGHANRPQPPTKAASDVADFPSIDFASLGISSAPESKLAGSSGLPRAVRSDSEPRRPRRRMSAPSA